MNSNLNKFIKFITSRLFILMVGFFFIFMILGIHLFKLQIIEGELHKNKVNTNVLRELPISAPRGTIYDRYGKPLAVNKIAMSIKLDPSIEVENQDEVLLNLIDLLEKNNEKIIDELQLSDEKPFEFTGTKNEELRWKAEVLGVSTEELTKEEIDMSGDEFFYELRKFFNVNEALTDEEARKLISLKYSLYQKRYKKYQPITVASDIKDKTIAELEENHDNYPGFYIDIEPIRYYPEGEVVSHILGYTGKITQEQYETLKNENYSLDDTVGRIGIEREMESYLRGQDGVTSVEVDPLGQRKEVHSVENPIPGGKVFLTLDLGLQKKVENILVNKLKDIILSRIEKSPSKNEPPIYLEDIFAGLVSTNTVYIEDILEAPLDTTQNSIAQVLEDKLKDMEEDQDKIALAKQTLIDMIKDKEISFKDFINVMIEQKVITLDESLKNNLDKGIISPVEIVKTKIQEGEISPHELGLDPSTGAAVVVDVHSGEVLSLVSYPSYDNNKFINGIDYEYYKKLQDDPTIPMFPRATNGRMAPGSTFKMVTGMAVLEEGVITPTEQINATGIFKDAGFPYARCWIYGYYHIGHGLTDISRALEVSCNYFFYDVSYRMAQTNNGEIGIEENGLNILKEYASKFGLDSKTGIEIGEYAPKLSDTDVIRSAIGQGTNNFAPIHMARYIATLANGGTLYDLHIIDSVKSFDGELLLQKEPIIKEKTEFNPENLETIYKGMNLVTEGEEGTVRDVFEDFPIKVAGKTGTAQEQLSRGEHAWFVGFAPYEDPQIAISVVIPYGYSSDYSAEIFRDIVAEYFGVNGENEKVSMDNVLY